MSHSRNGAGTRAQKNGEKRQAILDLPKKRSQKKKPTLYQEKTLFGRKSITSRFLVKPFASPRSQKKSSEMGLNRSLAYTEVLVNETTAGETTAILFLGTNGSTSPITIRTKSKKASPHHRSHYSMDKRPSNQQDENLPNRQSERLQLRKTFSTLHRLLSGIEDPLVKANSNASTEIKVLSPETIHKTRKNTEMEDCISLYKQPHTPQSPIIDPSEEDSLDAILKEWLLLPENIRKAKEIPAVESDVKIYTRRIWRKDIIDAEEKARTQSRTVFYGLSAQQLALYEETNVGKTRYEWLHLLAHSFGGDFSRDNIVAGSRDANTIMTLYDHAAKYLLEKELCNYIDIRIECTLKPRKDGIGFTHHAKEIRLSYRTDDGFIFYSPPINGDSIERPTVEMGEEILALIKEHYLPYKASLGKTGGKIAAQGTSSLWPALPAAKPKPQQKSILDYLPIESKGDTSSLCPPLLAANPKPQQKSILVYFFIKPKEDALSSCPPLPAANPTSQQKSIIDYFPIESKGDTSDNQQSSRKRKQGDLSTRDSGQQPAKRQKKNVPLTPITRFFSIENPSEKNSIQEQCLLKPPAPIEEPIAKRTRRNSIASMADVQSPVLLQPENKPKADSLKRKREQTNNKKNTPSNCSPEEKCTQNDLSKSTSAFFPPERKSKMPRRGLDTGLVTPLPSSGVFC